MDLTRFQLQTTIYLLEMLRKKKYVRKDCDGNKQLLVGGSRVCSTFAVRQKYKTKQKPENFYSERFDFKLILFRLQGRTIRLRAF